MLKLLLILFLFTNAYAADKVINPNVKVKEDAGGKYFEGKNGKRFEMQEFALTSQYTHQKPIINEAKILDDEEKDLVKKTLKENGRRLIMKELKPAKNDYHHDFDRGTVEYTPKNRNYSFHKVIIPDGTVVKNCNFTQKNPDTQAIQGENLVFIECNLVNNAINPSWTLINSNRAQIKRIKKSEEDLGGGRKKIIISHQAKDKNGVWSEVQEDYEETNNTDDYNLAILRLNE